MNLYQLFRQHSAGKAPFILSPDLNVLFNYDQMHEMSGRYANRLAALGVVRGDRVLVQIHKSAEGLMLYLACLRLGAVYLPLNTAYLDDELAFFANDAEPALIVCDATGQRFFESLNCCRVETLNKDGHGSFNSDLPSESDFETPVMEDNETAVILYTSGTTGRPKGAMLSHGNLISNAVTLLEAWQWQSSDVMLHALPVFHVHGLFVGLHLPLLAGCPIILLPHYDPQQVLELMPAATVYMGVPTHYTRLLQQPGLTFDTCSNMRLFTSGSAPLLESTFSDFEQRSGYRIVERYGMTETGMNTSNPLDGARKPGTVGPALPGVSLRIVDSNNHPVASGEAGDLQVRGKNVFSGYWKLPDKTAEEFTDDGYFRTGDIASLDRDGYVSIVGRNKDMIISGGLNIYPKEIESAIDKLPGVIESAIIGLPHPDFGEGVCAVVVTSADAELTAHSLIGSLKDKLANFKIPKWVFFEASLPRNTMGKVQKNVLRDKFRPQVEQA